MKDHHEHIAVSSFESEGIWHSVSALKLNGLLPVRLAMAEHGVRNIDRYTELIWQRQALWLNTFLSPGYLLPNGETVQRQIE